MPAPMSALAGSFKNAVSESVTTFHFDPPCTISDIDPDWSRTKYMSSGRRSPWRISPVQAASGSSAASVFGGVPTMGPPLEPDAPEVPIAPPPVVLAAPPAPVATVSAAPGRCAPLGPSPAEQAQSPTASAATTPPHALESALVHAPSIANLPVATVLARY
jgi:hypothetical protein